ncbi:MAG: O-antigen ligase family protein [Myxococcaceae bacterium]
MRRPGLAPIAEFFLWLSVALSAFAWGGAPTWVVLPLTGCVAAGLLASSLAWRKQGQRLPMPALAWIPLAMAWVCGIQLIPLPPGLLRFANPVFAEWVGFALEPLGLGRWRPISIDAPRTLLELAKHLSYTLLLVLGAAVAQTRTARRRVVASVVLTGVVLALSALGHRLFGVEALLGQWHFREAGPTVLTPFGNPNHLAAYLTLAGTLALGLAMDERSSLRDRPLWWLWGVCFGLCAVTAALTLSRAGFVFFVFGAVSFFALRRMRTRVLSVSVLGALVLTGYVAGEAFLREWKGVTGLSAWDSKIGMWPTLWRAAEAYPLGMGRGAFSLGFARFQDRAPHVAFTHAENGPLHLMAEVGPLLGVAFCVAAGVLLFRQWQQRRDSPLALASTCGAVALLFHELFDFALELPATAVAGSVVLGATSFSLVRRRLAPPTLSWPAVVSALGVMLVGAVAAGAQYETTEARLRALREQGPGTDVHPQLLASLHRHPMDHVLWMEGAIAALDAPKQGPLHALSFLNRALWLRPHDAAAHLWTARTLRRLGRNTQALVEYQLAYAGGLHPRYLIEEALPLARSGEALEALVPKDVAVSRDVLRRLLSDGRLSEAVAWVSEESSRRDDGTGEWDALVVRTLHQAKQTDAARQYVDAALARVGEVELLVFERAVLLESMGKGDEAERVRMQFLEKHPEAVEVAMALAEQRIRARRFVEAREALSRALAQSPEARARLLQVEAATYTHEGRRRRALESLTWVTRVVPDWPQPWLALSEAYEALGAYDEAMNTIRESQKRLPESKRGALEARLAQLGQRAQAARTSGQ